MKRDIISTTRPTVEGEMLWCVHYASSYYDDDPRMPGTVPIDAHFFVLARGQEDAIKKVSDKIEEVKHNADKNAKEKITATIVTIEGLVPTRDCSGDGRLGWRSSNNHAPVALSCEEDSQRYRLAVCLVPKD